MAYRFLLEVPESLAEDANVVVNAVEDAQVVLARDSHGLGFDDPYKDLTVAAHSLQVIDAIYAWYADLGADAPESRVNMRIVLHEGNRLSIHELTRAQMIAAIRRDQPWVEHTIPRIGDHDTKAMPGTEIIETNVVPDMGEDERLHGLTPALATGIDVGTRTGFDTRVRPIMILATDEAKASEGVTIAGVPHVVIKVADLAVPERAYGELFGAEVVGRARRRPAGGWDLLPPAYDVEQEAQWGEEPDVAVLQNGPLSLALQREGRGYPLPHLARIQEPIRLTVDMPSLSRVRGLVMMRNYTVFDSRPNSFTFRDPFGYTWALLGVPEEER